MANPITAWRADHANFARLLNFVERQLLAFHLGELLDYPLLLAILYYLRDYPDRVHHPREDVAFARLVERDPTLQLLYDSLESLAASGKAGVDMRGKVRP